MLEKKIECPNCKNEVNFLVRQSGGFSYCPVCGCIAKEFLVIKITKIPDSFILFGSKEVLVGCEVLAEGFFGSTIDFLPEGRFRLVKTYMATINSTVDILEEQVEGIGKQLRNFLPKGLSYLHFKTTEAKVVNTIALFKH